MNAKTHLAVGALVQAAAHQHGLTGPMPFTVCGPRNYDWCGLDDDYVSEGDNDNIEIETDTNTRPVEDEEFFYMRGCFR